LRDFQGNDWSFGVIFFVESWNNHRSNPPPPPHSPSSPRPSTSIRYASLHELGLLLLPKQHRCRGAHRLLEVFRGMSLLRCRRLLRCRFPLSRLLSLHRGEGGRDLQSRTSVLRQGAQVSHRSHRGSPELPLLLLRPVRECSTLCILSCEKATEEREEQFADDM